MRISDCARKQLSDIGVAQSIPDSDTTLAQVGRHAFHYICALFCLAIVKSRRRQARVYRFRR
eukprot:4058158-Amphidinium_carterae.1